MKIKLILRTFTHYRKIVVLLHQASGRVFYYALLANLGMGLTPGILIYLGAQLIERLSKGSTLTAVSFLILTYVILSGFQEVIQAVASFIVDTLQDRVKMMIKHQVNHLISTYPTLEIYEQASLREITLLAEKSADKLSEFVASAFYVTLGFLTTLPILALTSHIMFWIPWISLIATFPLLMVKAHIERKSWDIQTYHAATFNHMHILEKVLTQAEYAKDLRIYGMQEKLLRKWKRYYTSYLQDAVSARQKHGLLLMIVALVSSMVLVFPFYAVVNRYSQGQIGIGDLSLFITAILQLKGGLSSIIYHYSDLLGTAYAMEPYQKLVDTLKSLSLRPIERLKDDSVRLKLSQLCFRYEGIEKEVLNNINLSLRTGETLALVGENGAGKSTLIKLICRFYLPSAGSIQWHLADHAEPRVMGIFQDFARFPLTTLENLVNEDKNQAEAALKCVDLKFLTNQFDKPLTPEVEGGINLSGGQWQRLALARVMIQAKEADLLIFDEPTASLDPVSEGKLMRLILELSKNQSTLIISHRLALTRFVDRILVMEEGRITEEGSHEQLMQLKGKYYHMFRSQADWYT